MVQEVLGHASTSTTQRYTYASKEHILSTLQSAVPFADDRYAQPRAPHAQFDRRDGPRYSGLH